MRGVVIHQLLWDTGDCLGLCEISQPQFYFLTVRMGNRILLLDVLLMHIFISNSLQINLIFISTVLVMLVV